MVAYEKELGELERQKKDIGQSGTGSQRAFGIHQDPVGNSGPGAGQFHGAKKPVKFEQQLRGEGPNPVEDAEERMMLEELIAPNWRKKI